MYGTPVYVSWYSMLSRCRNKNFPGYKKYGGAGITVCERWHSFINFYEDMGDRPPGMTIDRKDNSLGYFAKNCRWATRKEQSVNRGYTFKITHNGVTRCVKEWSELTGLSVAAIQYRKRSGWTDEQVISIPKHHKP